jgi:anaerobic selenocysteine-containing dehydrogenase
VVETRHSFCRNCGAHCGVRIDVEDNRIVKLIGDRDNAITRGYFCPKGGSSAERQNGLGRMPGSLRRSGDSLLQVPTAAAVREITERFRELRERYGPRSVGLYYGTAAFGSATVLASAKSWAAALETPAVFSSQTVDQSPKAIRAFRMGNFRSGKPAFSDSDVWVLSGTNPVVSHLGGWNGSTMYSPRADIRAARRRGLRLVVIDPRETETARLADLHLRPRPGQDVAVHAALLNVVLSEGLQDDGFCARWVDGLDALAAAVRRYTPERAEIESGVPAEDLRRAARLFATARRGHAVSGTGTNMAPFANLAEHLLECLNAVCGRYQRAGDRVANPSLLHDVPVQEGVDGAYPVWDHSPRMASHPDVGWALPGEYPTNLLADEILHEGDGRLRALVVVGGNPVRAMPDQQRARRALANLELLVTLDIQMSETARMSDYVISCKTPYERADVSVMTDMGSPFAAAQYTEAVLDPPADAIEEWEFFHDTAVGLGLALDWSYFAYGSPPTGRSLRLDGSRRPTTESLLEFVCQSPDLSFRDLVARPGAHVPDVAPRYVAPPPAGETTRLTVLPAEVLEELEECWATHQGQALSDGQLLLHVRRRLEVMNSVFMDGSALAGEEQNALYMHPDDMAARGVEAGAQVRVASDHGRLSALAQVDASQLPGTVSLHHCWAADDADRTVSALIDSGGIRERHNFVPRMSAIPVVVSAGAAR